MNKTRRTHFPKTIFFAAAICVMMSGSTSGQVSGIWQMDTGQTFLLNQDGTSVTGVFTGNNFGGTLVVGEQTSDGAVKLFGVGSTGSLYHIDLELNADDTLTGSVLKRNFLASPQQFTFNAGKPYSDSYSELDGFWELTDVENKRSGSYLTVITYEVRGVRTQIAFEILTLDGVPFGVANVYTGRAFSQEGAFVWVGDAGVLFGTYEGESLDAGRLPWFSSAAAYVGRLLIKRERE